MSTVVVNGFFVGLVYGLLAVGLVVVYRGSRVINFAYGETGMLAAFLFSDLRFGTGAAAVSLGAADRGLLVALPAAVVIGAALGAAAEILVARPLRDAPRIRALVGTFALGALFLTYAIRRWGLSARYVKPVVDGPGIELAGVRIVPGQLLILAVSVAVLAGLAALYRYSAFGLRLRATALDPYAAGLVGVNVNRTSVATWALAGSLAALSAVLIAPLVPFNVLFMTTLTIRALAAALVGGFTSLGGAFTAGVLLGIAEGVIGYQAPVSGITDGAIALFVVLLMLARPGGLVRSAY
ncbi:MAG: branched-chain amino acid ABC transporter permease [Actinomycetota bacterium]